jgi:hypothetical protein
VRLALAITVAAVLAAIVIAAIAFARRLRVRVSLQASAHESGVWAVAGGGSIGPIMMTGGAASGAPSVWEVRVLGRRLASSRKAKPRERRARPSFAERLEKKLGVDGIVDLALRAFARVRLDAIEGRVKCAAGDPEWSGPIAGTLGALSGVLTPLANVTTEIDWLADAASLEISCGLEASFVPFLIGWDTLRVVVPAALKRQPRESKDHGQQQQHQ